MFGTLSPWNGEIPAPNQITDCIQWSLNHTLAQYGKELYIRYFVHSVK